MIHDPYERFLKNLLIMSQSQADSSWFQNLTIQSILAAFVLCFALFALASGSIFMTIATQEMTANQMAAALVTQVAGHGLLTYSLKQFSAGLISVALLAVPIIAAGLAMVLFGQKIQPISSIAFLVVLIGIYLTVTAPKKEAETVA